MNTKELNALFNHYYHLDELVEFPEIGGLNLTKQEALGIMRMNTNAFDAYSGLLHVIRRKERDVIASKLHTNRNNQETY